MLKINQKYIENMTKEVMAKDLKITDEESFTGFMEYMRDNEWKAWEAKVMFSGYGTVKYFTKRFHELMGNAPQETAVRPWARG